jgi:hypothetical protein
MKLQDQVTASPSSAVLHIPSWCWSQWLHRVISWSLQNLQITPINHVGFLSLKFAGCIKSQGDCMYCKIEEVMIDTYTDSQLWVELTPLQIMYHVILYMNISWNKIWNKLIAYCTERQMRWWFHLCDDLLWTWNKLSCNFRIFTL